ncbi:metal-dependent hydrolase [Halobacterium litoreum]|uniref:Metal-dependent hydrolase n=1 Tax=Halobacterium litoreum TaxID=2039234 RepID=A0ABD5NBY0_9EURY|nr:metal-dependent hydrolase [Halobacterium litoreum]UHH14410.1 metal-dependent hydrolase [Halobacterium litoreum]
MWPWGHLAFGYVCVSALTRVFAGRPPSDREALLVLLATQLPDLVDKPLGWGLDLYATGYGAAHSVLVAGPLLLVVLAYAVRKRSVAALAFVAAYASHPAGDVLSALLDDNPAALSRVLWPVADLPAYGTERGFAERALHYFAAYATELADPTALAALAAYASVFAAVGALWLYDGAPGTGLLRDAERRARRR